MGVPSLVGSGIHQALCTASALGFGKEFCASLTKAQAKLNGIEIAADH